MGKRELVALLCLSSYCLVIVVWPFLTMPGVRLQFVIVLSPDHTHLLFFLFIVAHQITHQYGHFRNYCYMDKIDMNI